MSSFNDPQAQIVSIGSAQTILNPADDEKVKFFKLERWVKSKICKVEEREKRMAMD